MTEQEWLTCDDPAKMLGYLTRGNASPAVAGGQGWRTSDRKLRLFACADFRSRASQSGNAEQLALADRVEKWADGGPPIPRSKWPETSYFVLSPDAVDAARRQCCEYEPQEERAASVRRRGGRAKGFADDLLGPEP